MQNQEYSILQYNFSGSVMFYNTLYYLDIIGKDNLMIIRIINNLMIIIININLNMIINMNMNLANIL